MHLACNIVHCMDEATGDLASAIGVRVRRARRSRGWTLDQLAEAAGVGLPALVEPPQTSALTVTRRGEGAVLWSGEAGGQGRLVAGSGPPDVLELWDWVLGPGDQHTSEAHTPRTTELIHVQKGVVTVQVADRSVSLATGDAVSFTGDVAHSYANPGRQSARFSLAVFEPGEGRRHGRVLPMPEADASGQLADVEPDGVR